jgi:DNA-directed RNA polymerase subunit RPC12/RpoP
MVALEAMSEFKFACPVCGQHITADSSTSGGQIECPTCFQKIVVPQAPTSQDTKFILSASQVAKPRPGSAEAASQLGPVQTSSHHSSVLAIVVLIILVGAAGAALFVFRDRVFKFAHVPPPVVTNAPPLPPAAPVALNTTYPIPTNINWTLDLTNAALPDTAAAGSVHGCGFVCERTTLEGGTLSLRQGRTWPPDLGFTVLLTARQGEDLAGKTVEITPDRTPPLPRVVLRWKDDQQQPQKITISRGYALKVAFGQPAHGRMPGRIYLCLPDAAKSFVAGTFDAEIRKPPPPKPPTSKPPKPKT